MICLRNHEQGADLLIGYLEGTLPTSQRTSLDLHAAECGDCRGLLAVQESLDYPVPEVSANFDARLYARIAEDTSSSWLPGWLSRWSSALSMSFSFRPLLAGSAVLAMSLAGVVMVQAPWSSRFGAQPVTVTEPGSSHVETSQKSAPEDLKQASVDREIEQLERDLEDVELLVPLSAVSKESI